LATIRPRLRFGVMLTKKLTVVTESEIENAESFSARRDFAAALDLHQEMLLRAEDDGVWVSKE